MRENGQVRGRLLFRFAVVTDTHVNHEEAGTTSPWHVNRLANGRARHAFRTINTLNPEFLVHVGDMVHPTPTQNLYMAAVDRFNELVRELRCPFYLTPGNHDIGDKAIEWTPAKPISDETLAIYERAFGRSYYAFSHGSCRFLILNSLLLGSGLSAEAEQWAWLETELAGIRNERTFVFLHDPPFTTDPAETDSYDNILMPERERLLALFAAHRVEAVISGHVHNFWYNRLDNTEFYILPSTAFVRQDYSELYKIEPGDEGGRNDAPKLGIAAVDVYERGHVLHVIRTNGIVAEPRGPAPAQTHIVELLHTKTAPNSRVGIDLRHPWTEILEIAPSSGVDEFGRKLARNDYPLQAFWEMGVAKLRVPVQDLANGDIRARMRLMVELGHEFTIYSYDIPRKAELEAIRKYTDLISTWEVILSPTRIGERLTTLADLKANLPLRIHLSKLHVAHQHAASGRHFAHAINHGFTLEDAEEIKTLFESSGFRNSIDGLVYRVARNSPVLAALPAISDFSAKHSLDSSIHVRLAAENPAELVCDDRANADRVAETLIASLLLRSGENVFLDTFDDVDRGFFRRHGLYDRRINPRMGAQVFRHLQIALRGLAGSRMEAMRASLPDGVSGVETDGEIWLLVKSSCEAGLEQMLAAIGKNSISDRGEKIDLASGAVEHISLASSQGLAVSAPLLLRFKRLHGTMIKKVFKEEIA
jgi:3',5'-cyclic AMP phosphodiesterase CpdA